MTSRKPLVVERLEDRWCPALTASLKGGTLTVSGAADNGSIQVVQSSTTAGSIKVLDGTTEVGSFTGVKNVRLNLGSADDVVAIDLGGQSLSGSILANLGGGANELTLTNGTLGRLSVGSGEGDDEVTLGDGSTALSVKDADLTLFGGIDTVTVKSGVEVTRSLTTFYANDVTLEAGSTSKNVLVRGGTGGNAVTVAGDVTGDLAVDAFFRGGSDMGTTLTVSGEVDGNLFFAGSNQADTVTLSGNVGRGVGIATFGGADTVSITGAITRGLALDTGAGNDTITLDGVVGGRSSVFAGDGDDALTIGAHANFQAATTISMGAGADTVTLHDDAKFLSLLINGGSGTDTFNGNRTRTGLTLISF